MDNFQKSEIRGRKLLESFLLQVNATDLRPTEDQYNPVDYYFTCKNKKIVAEIKVRDRQYENYDTHLMEVSKYNALIAEKQQQHLDRAYYICFFEDGDKINAYWYDTTDIYKYALRKSMYCNRTTAYYSGTTCKDVLLIPTNKAHRFTFYNGKWQQ